MSRGRPSCYDDCAACFSSVVDGSITRDVGERRAFVSEHAMPLAALEAAQNPLWVGRGGEFRFMVIQSELVAYVTAELKALGSVQTCPIFGGVGVQIENRLVAVIMGQQVYLHTDEHNRPDYTSRGMGPLRPYSNAFDLTTDQYECPDEIVRDPAQLRLWAQRALQASIASARAKQLAGIERSRKAKAAKRAAKQAEKKKQH